VPVATLRIVLAVLVVVWAATAVMDARRLESGYVLEGSIGGQAPVSQKIEFSALHKSIVAILAIGIIVGVALAVLGRGYGPSIAVGSAAATVLVGVWSVKRYGIFGAPFSGAQFVSLLALVVVSYLILRR
jgi:hypothetical protein